MNYKWNKIFQYIKTPKGNKNMINLYLTDEKVRNC